MCSSSYLLVAWRGTLLLVTHDRRLAERVGERLLIVENRKVRAFEGALGEYEAR
ncbi:MAG: hypothetical protein LBS93_02775 [Synergistaceae bacterium]|jgi:ATPase subunit of ABC transporter with duplicated ATPase domains|nr:hypothetical protein [Synergistaceae bacterium]